MRGSIDFLEKKTYSVLKHFKRLKPALMLKIMFSTSPKGTGETFFFGNFQRIFNFRDLTSFQNQNFFF
jgi:hypothetical protein